MKERSSWLEGTGVGVDPGPDEMVLFGPQCTQYGAQTIQGRLTLPSNKSGAETGYDSPKCRWPSQAWMKQYSILRAWACGRTKADLEPRPQGRTSDSGDSRSVVASWIRADVMTPGPGITP